MWSSCDGVMIAPIRQRSRVADLPLLSADFGQHRPPKFYQARRSLAHLGHVLLEVGQVLPDFWASVGPNLSPNQRATLAESGPCDGKASAALAKFGPRSNLCTLTCVCLVADLADPNAFADVFLPQLAHTLALLTPIMCDTPTFSGVLCQRSIGRARALMWDSSISSKVAQRPRQAIGTPRENTSHRS